MKMKNWISPGVTGILAVLICLSSFGIGFAQLEELQTLGEQEEVKCTPDSLTTYYDRFKSDSVSEQQLNIWYSLAKEDFKYKNYKHAIPYYWKILVNDTTGKFKIAYSKLADCYYNLNLPDSVFIVCYRGLELYPDQTRLHYWAGYLHDLLGQTKCAIPQYEALVKENPEEKQYWAKLAYLYYKEDDCKAVQAQQKVVDLDPSDIETKGM